MEKICGEVLLAHFRQRGTAEKVRTVDIAPTLARLVGVPAPDDLAGHDVLGPPEVP